MPWSYGTAATVDGKWMMELLRGDKPIGGHFFFFFLLLCLLGSVGLVSPFWWLLA
jgi:hypothetical protein